MSDIIVKFKPDGHTDLIKAINNLIKAQKKFGGENKSTTQTVTKLNSKVLKLISHYGSTAKAAKATGVGVNIMTKALKGNANAMALVESRLKKVNSRFSVFGTRNKRNAASLGMFGNTLSTVRSKLLLFNFAMAMGIKQLGEMAKRSAKLESLRKGFDSLTGSTVKSTEMLLKLKVATNGTMDQMALMEQANSAMVLGVTKNSDEMSEMFDMAQRLGRALGVDTKRSIESLITGLGRQSVKMLDNIGIVVKSNEAYQKHAKVLKTTVDRLTDGEKRQAFMNAAMEAGKKKVEELGTETSGSQDIMDGFSVLVTELGDAFMDFGGPAISAGLDQLTTFVRFFTESDLEEQVRIFTEAGVAIEDMQETINALSIEKAEEQLTALRVQIGQGFADLVPMGYGINVDLPGSKLLIIQYDALKNSINNTMKGVDGLNKSFAKGKTFSEQWDEYGFGEIFQSQGEMVSVDMERLTEPHLVALGKLSDKYAVRIAELISMDTERSKESAKAVGHYKILVDTIIRNGKVFIKLKEEMSGIGKDTAEKEKDALDGLETANLKHFAIIEGNTNATKRLAIEEENRKKILKELKDLRSEKFDINDEKRLNDLEAAEKRILVLEAKKIKNKELIIKLEQQTQQQMLKTASDALKTGASLLAMGGKNAKEVAILQAGAAMVDAYAAAQSTRAQVAKILPPPFPDIAWGTSIATGIVNANKIMSLANQVGSGGSSVGKFEQGGYVGGRRHSQGGTIIEAERGEFVMSRNAVESIGLETLSMMNEGGGGAVNITVTGNVMTQDFVEGELAESIKEAVRRGSDFGIS